MMEMWYHVVLEIVCSWLPSIQEIENNNLLLGSLVGKGLEKSIFIGSNKTKDIIEYLEKEISITLSKLDLPSKFTQSIETYVLKLSVDFKNKGVLPQDFLAPKNEVGRINYFKFLSQLIPGNEMWLIQPSVMKSKAKGSFFNVIWWAVFLDVLFTIYLTLFSDWIAEVDDNDQKLLRDLGLQLYILRQVYSLDTSKNVFTTVKTCYYLVFSDRIEILRFLSQNVQRSSISWGVMLFLWWFSVTFTDKIRSK